MAAFGRNRTYAESAPVYIFGAEIKTEICLIFRTYTSNDAVA